MTSSINLGPPSAAAPANGESIGENEGAARSRRLDVNKGWIILLNMTLSGTVHLWTLPPPEAHHGGEKVSLFSFSPLFSCIKAMYILLITLWLQNTTKKIIVLSQWSFLSHSLPPSFTVPLLPPSQTVSCVEGSRNECSVVSIFGYIQETLSNTSLLPVKFLLWHPLPSSNNPSESARCGTVLGNSSPSIPPTPPRTTRPWNLKTGGELEGKSRQLLLTALPPSFFQLSVFVQVWPAFDPPAFTAASSVFDTQVHQKEELAEGEEEEESDN